MSDAYNAAEREDVKEASKRAKAAERARRELIVHIMDINSGRAWLLEILEACHIFSPSFTPNALQMAFNEGERNVGLQLLASVMRYCPDKYTDMMRERNARDSASERRRSQNANGRDQGRLPDDIAAELAADYDVDADGLLVPKRTGAES
jgi:hypothetical protein